jgi:uncharacterized LabA/DUF88 family protein
VSPKHTGLRAGVYVDVENVSRNGGRGMWFETLRDYACRDGAEALRLNAYLAYDERRAREDPLYRNRATSYHFALRAAGFKVIEKPVQWYENEEGIQVSKANSDLDLAVDMLLQSAKLDRVVLVSGDGDFVQVVRALQNMGCRVELLAFQNVSYNLRCESDLFLSGYLIPELLPDPEKRPPWGELGSRLRGTCRYYNHPGGFGFLRYLSRIGDLTKTDMRDPESPFREAYFHATRVAPGVNLSTLPDRDMIFEFTLVEGRNPSETAAEDIELVYRYNR